MQVGDGKIEALLEEEQEVGTHGSLAVTKKLLLIKLQYITASF